MVKGKVWKRGVSPLLATIILIAITVAAGLVIYNLFFSTAGTMSTQLNIQIVSVEMVKTSSTTLVSVAIKNTGNKPITSCTVTFYGDTNSSDSLSLVPTGTTMDPGQTKSNSKTTTALSVTVGKSYPVQIVAQASDGSKIDKSFTVTCMG